jgi:hypothetical protein
VGPRSGGSLARAHYRPWSCVHGFGPDSDVVAEEALVVAAGDGKPKVQNVHSLMVCCCVRLSTYSPEMPPSVCARLDEGGSGESTRRRSRRQGAHRCRREGRGGWVCRGADREVDPRQEDPGSRD